MKDSRMLFVRLMFVIYIFHEAAGGLSLMSVYPDHRADVTAASVRRPESERRWVPPVSPPPVNDITVGSFCRDFRSWLNGVKGAGGGCQCGGGSQSQHHSPACI